MIPLIRMIIKMKTMTVKMRFSWHGVQRPGGWMELIGQFWPPFLIVPDERTSRWIWWGLLYQDEEENGDVHFLYHSNDDSDESDDKTRRSDRSQVGLSCKLHEQTDVSLHFSSANWQVYLQSSLLHFSSTYQAGPVTWLQQSTKSATQCNAKQIR